MAENIISIPVPHEEREQALPPTRFIHALSKRGWTVERVCQVYTDPDVFRQKWLICPNRARYSERTFYDAFGSTHFRKLFRYALSHVPCTKDTLTQICSHESLLVSSLTFLQDQEWFHFHGRWFERGLYQTHISNIGRTLEWYVAEWFRLTYSFPHLVPVCHGVQLAAFPILDVVAFLNNERVVMVECKSSSEVDEDHYLLFLKRVQAFHPDVAIFLTDTPAPFSPMRIAAFNRALQHLGYPPLAGSRGFYWGPMNVYMVNVAHSIAISSENICKKDKKSLLEAIIWLRCSLLLLLADASCSIR